MEANKILQSDLLDILFENRNKAYGAYELRRSYGSRIASALAIALLTLGAIFTGLYFTSLERNSAKQEVVVRDVVIENIKESKPPPPPPPPPKKEPPPPPPAQVKAPPVPQQIQTTKFTPPVIKKDVEVVRQEIAPVTEVQKVDVVTSEGTKDLGKITNLPSVSTETGVVGGTGVVEAPPAPKVDENKIFEKVEVEASVNSAQWRRHLESLLVRYIEDAASQGMAPGKYTVNVRFLVEKDGSIGDVKALNDPGYGLARGAVDAIRKGPRWSAGEQNGQKVRSYHTQPITFVINDGVL